MSDLLGLSPDQIDLWLTPLDDPRLTESIAEYWALLAPTEQLQHDRFRFAKDKHRYLVTRALIREVLSKYAPADSRDWVFSSDRYGKPFISHPRGFVEHISFNISHSDALVVVAIARDRAVGVDTERPRSLVFLEEANHFLTSKENASIRALPLAIQRWRFLELWTLKESYVKARGVGLSLSLESFGFEFGPEPGLIIEFGDTSDDSPSRWHFSQFRYGPDNLLALCVERLGNSVPVIVARRFIPLAFEKRVQLEMIRSSADGIRSAIPEEPVGSP